MADIAIPDGPSLGAMSPREDAPPSSAGSHAEPFDAPPLAAAPPVYSDEVKARLDKIVYSDVSGDFLLVGNGLLEICAASSLHVRLY